jgi:hypothetical protein
LADEKPETEIYSRCKIVNDESARDFGLWRFRFWRKSLLWTSGTRRDAQFVIFDVRGKERPAAGWPEGAFGAQGTSLSKRAAIGEFCAG